ncbi:MAG TPA: 5-formyltetrahydrofolate cyclo-ligase [Burkholderiales bacterium]|nr:5-formyltetrahydrofolate cyclo-ligase [Burkholderiales bacterium]
MEPITGRDRDPDPTLRQRKQAQRSDVLAWRSALDPVERPRLGHAITQSLLNLPEFQRARCVLAYLSFGSELDTAEFVRALPSRACALVLPRIDLSRHSLSLHRVDDPELDTVPGVWGIREPDPQRCPLADATAIDAVLVPGVAFTPRGERLGYGGGFYDRLIREWRDPPPLIAAAFELQVVQQLPLGPNDQPIDAVVTEARLYRRGPQEDN